jgi:CspA family cold shock protein
VYTYARGTVRFWLDDEGWGVVDSSETPGGCFVHFSFVQMDGYRSMVEGQAVDLEWERPQWGDYEGYAYFAQWLSVMTRSMRAMPATKK